MNHSSGTWMLRSRILLLALLICVLLASALTGFFLLLRQTQSALTGQAWERLLIDRALEAANGNKAEAARRLGIHRRLLYEKLGSEES